MSTSTHMDRSRAAGIFGLAAAAILLSAALVATLCGPWRSACGPGAQPSAGDSGGKDHACRFWGIVTTAPQDSLIYDQLVGGAHSFMSLAGGNSDGWSVAYHSPALAAAGLPRAQVLHGWPSADHASDARYRDAVAEMLSMGALCGVAHLRNASPGTHVGIPDPHFFCREGVTFGHNGGLSESGLVSLLEAGSPGYLDSHPPDYESPYLDSELLFMYILKIREEGPPRRGTGGTSLGQAMMEGVLAAYDAGAIETAANCIAATGDSILAVRFDLNDQKKYRVRYREIATGWVVSSEPVGSDTTGWFVLPPKSVGVFRATGQPDISTIYPPEWPRLVVSWQAVDDDLEGGSMGDADGVCDAGEAVELQVALRNDGDEVAHSVTASLSTTDQYCCITDGTEEYGDIDPGTVVPCAEDFDIEIDPACPDGHAALLTLRVESSERRTWELDIELDIAAPSFGLYGYTIDDARTGDGNGHVDRGESFGLTPVLVNSGSADATGLDLLLALAHPQASVLAADASLALLPAGGKNAPAPPFVVNVGAGAGDPDVLFCETGISADWGQSGLLQLLVPVGGFWDEIESGVGDWVDYAVTGGFLNQWHLSTARNFTADGGSSWKCGASGSGDYANLLDAALESEPVTLRAHSFLRFRHWMDAEASASNPGRCYDGGMVEFSVDGGSWTQIHPVGGYSHSIIEGSVHGPWPADTEVYSGGIDWEEELFEMAGLSGTARFRFRFGSDGAYAGEGWYVDDVEFFGTDELPVSVQDPSGAPGAAVALLCPNPLGAGSKMTYRLSVAAQVVLRVYDPSGRLVRSFEEGRRPAGSHPLDWDGRDERGRELANGVYFARLEAGRDTALRKLVVLRNGGR